MKSLRQQAYGYNIYKLSVKEKILYGFEGGLIISLFGYFFYRSLLITILASPGIYFYVLYKAKISKNKRKTIVRYQFKEILVSLSGSLRAGYSIENAFLEAEKDINSFYGKSSVMAKELSVLRTGLKNNKPLTELIVEMSKRCEIDEMKEFADVLIIGKQTGGNLVEIIERYVHIAEDKTLVLQEIETIINSKKYEQKIMNAIPFLIIFYIEITSKGFFDVLYNSIFGRIVMTLCLLIYLFAIWLSERIVNIPL